MYCLSMISPVYQWILDWNAYPPPPPPSEIWKYSKKIIVFYRFQRSSKLWKLKCVFILEGKALEHLLMNYLYFRAKIIHLTWKENIHLHYSCIYIVHLKKKFNCNKRLGIHVISIYILRSSLVYELILNSHSVLIKKVNKSDNFVQWPCFPREESDLIRQSYRLPSRQGRPNFHIWK